MFGYCFLKQVSIFYNRKYKKHIWQPNAILYLWNQNLVNLSFDDNKTKFKTNYYILSMFRQDDFQSGNHKDK